MQRSFKVANLTIKDLSDDLYDDLKKSAAVNRRSIAAQATLLLEQGLHRRPVDATEIRSRARAVREKSPAYLTEEKLRSAIDEGRA